MPETSTQMRTLSHSGRNMRNLYPTLSTFICLFLLLGACATPHAASPSEAGDAEPFWLRSKGRVIAGEVAQAPGTAPKIAVIIVGGSGARVRKDTEAAVPFFRDENTAVVTYDRRGNGESTGEYAIPDTLNTAWQIPRFADDVAAIAAHLKRHGYERVGLVGTSMGGWINVAAAAKTRAIDFVVCFSGGASSVGVSDEFDRLTDEGLTIAEAIAAARRYDGPSGYDPQADLKAMKQPGLFVFGDEDDSNPTALDVEVLEAMQSIGKPLTVIVLPRANHDFIDIDTGEMNTDWTGPVKAFIQGD